MERILFIDTFKLNCSMNARLSLSVVALLSLLHFRSVAQSGYITTLVGNGVTQYIGDGYPATNLSLAMPKGICVASDGSVYSTDFLNQRIRRTNIADSVFTCAGTGVAGYSGNGAAATVATMHNPHGIALDAAGNIFFVDQYNDVVRKIDKVTGNISVVCGTGGPGYTGDNMPALEANMEQPAGLCFDRAGNMYIADYGNARVRKVNSVTGIITTIAGTGVAGFSGDNDLATSAKIAYPVSVCTDSSDNLYIADYGNNRIRKVDASSGIITTFAGTGVIGYGGDAGLATAAKLTQPTSVFMSTKGNLYIADYGNNVVRMVNPAGNIYTIAGSGGYGYTGDHGPAINATFISPSAVCTDTAENIYIADEGNSAIRVVQKAADAINDLYAKSKVSVYPNPSTGIFYLNISGAANSSLVVFNLVGQVVYKAEANDGVNVIDISLAANGIYYLSVQTGADKRTIKILKQ